MAVPVASTPAAAAPDRHEASTDPPNAIQRAHDLTRQAASVARTTARRTVSARSNAGPESRSVTPPSSWRPTSTNAHAGSRTSSKACLELAPGRVRAAASILESSSPRSATPPAPLRYGRAPDTRCCLQLLRVENEGRDTAHRRRVQIMTTVGLVGGLGPESTIDYYRRILAACERDDAATAPSIVIDSLDVEDGAAARRGGPARIHRLPRGLRRAARRGRRRLRGDDRQHRAPRVRRGRGPLARAARQHRRDVRVDGAAPRDAPAGAARHAIHDGGAVLPGRCARGTGIDVVVPDAEDRARVHARYIGSC